MANISKNEIESCLASPKNSDEKATLQEDTRGSVCYTVGLQIVDESSDAAYAKRVVVNEKEIHYIKQDRYGNLFNPQGMYSERNQSQSTRFSKTWDFRVVTPKAFDLYLKFLETKNEAWLSNAERELA